MLVNCDGFKVKRKPMPGKSLIYAGWDGNLSSFNTIFVCNCLFSKLETAQQGAETPTMTQPETKITLFHRTVAAGGASLVSAIVVNPLDVVKTRIQAQGAADRVVHHPQTLLEKWNFAGCGPSCVRMADPALPTSACGPACAPVTYKGTWDGLRKIARAEGLRSLWRGTDVALMMSIPMVGIYLPLYDYMLADLHRYNISGVAPLLAGTGARTVAVFCTAPFELIRTRMQAVRAPVASLAVTPASGGSTHVPSSLLLSHLPRDTGSGKLRALGRLWTGVGATLARDVPFSALYWAMVEPTRAYLMPNGATTEMEVATTNIIAGGVSGALAGTVTTPLDLVKTRTQLATGETVSRSLYQSLKTIARNEGLPALFTGWSARSAKAAPACAMVLSAYEMLKFMYM